MSGVETENIDESKATASESEYSDDNNEKTEIKTVVRPKKQSKTKAKKDGRAGRTVNRRAGGKHTPAMQAKIEKMWAGRDRAVRARRLAKKKIEAMEKKLKEYELKEIEEGIYKRVKKKKNRLESRLDRLEKLENELPLRRPVLRRETAVEPMRMTLNDRRRQNPTPAPIARPEPNQEPNPFAGYF